MTTTNRTSAMLAAIAIAAGLSACSSNPPTGSQAYKAGELGNGDFLFTCEDGAACLPYSGAAAKFPQQIASGSTFDIRFVAKAQQGTTINTGSQTYPGVTITGVSPYVNSAPATGGFAAIKPGYATLYAQDSAGSLIDFTKPIRVVQVEELVLYDADKYKDENDAADKIPERVTSFEVTVGSAKTYRIRAEAGGQPLAGSIAVEWKCDDGGVSVANLANVGVIRGVTPGTSVVTVEGAGVTKTIQVTVKAAVTQ